MCASSVSSTCAPAPPTLFSTCASMKVVPCAAPFSTTRLAWNGGGVSSMGCATSSAATASSAGSSSGTSSRGASSTAASADNSSGGDSSTGALSAVLSFSDESISIDGATWIDGGGALGAGGGGG